jgi:hypothetical protein
MSCVVIYLIEAPYIRLYYLQGREKEWLNGKGILDEVDR